MSRWYRLRILRDRVDDVYGLSQEGDPVAEGAVGGVQVEDSSCESVEAVAPEPDDNHDRSYQGQGDHSDDGLSDEDGDGEFLNVFMTVAVFFSVEWTLSLRSKFFFTRAVIIRWI